MKWVADFDPSQRVRVVEGDKEEWLPADIYLLQALYHAHEHRTHITTILGQLGLATPAISA